MLRCRSKPPRRAPSHGHYQEQASTAAYQQTGPRLASQQRGQSAAEFAALSGKRRDTLKAIVHARQAKAAVELAWRTAIADAQLSLEE
jgi:hypothetical protein